MTENCNCKTLWNRLKDLKTWGDMARSFLVNVGIIRTILSIVLADMTSSLIHVINSASDAYSLGLITLGESTTITMISLAMLLIILIYLIEYGERILRWGFAKW